MEEKDLKAIEEGVKGATEAVKQMKDATEKVVGEVKSEVVELKSEIKVIKDAADKNQAVIDEFVASKNQNNVKGGQSFNAALAEGIQEKYDSIRSLKKGQSVSFEVKAPADMSFSASFSDAAASVTEVKPGIVAGPSRKLHIRQLLSGGSMSTSNFAYVKELGGEEGPETVAEGSAKNQFDIDLSEVESPSQYIAGYVRISRKMLDDVAGMTTFLQSRLIEKLLREEDAQLLNGDGNSPNLAGITAVGNHTAASNGGTVDVEQLINAIAQVEGYDREATAVLVSPSDYWRIAMTKTQGGEYTLPAGIVVVGEDGVLRIGGVPVHRTTALAADKFIVGDFAMGANLLVREAPRVEFFYEDGTNVRENKVTVRVEERIAFPIYGDNYFVYGDFGNVS